MAFHGGAASIRIAVLASMAVVWLLGRQSSADVNLYYSSPTFLDDDLVSFTLAAHSTEGETIIGIRDPIITGFGMGLHQVWTPFELPTPTRKHQLEVGPLWNDAWRPYDSYFFFDGSNSVALGEFIETNSKTGGVTLPSSVAGPPVTGFGTYGYTGSSASMAFTLASGKQGPNVEFAQLVFRINEHVAVDLEVLTHEGAMQFEDFIVQCSHCGDGPAVVDKHLGNVPQGAVIEATLETHPLFEFEPALWQLYSFTGPGGQTVVGATVDPNSGQFTWDSSHQPLGSYSATIGIDLFGNQLASGLLTFALVVPEPSCFILVALSLLGGTWLRRR